MLTQNKKIIIYAVVTLVVILIMLGLTGFIIQFLTKKLNQALTYKASPHQSKGFDFESLKALNIKEINDVLTPVSTSSEGNITSLSSTSTQTTSTLATSTSSTNQ